MLQDCFHTSDMLDFMYTIQCCLFLFAKWTVRLALVISLRHWSTVSVLWCWKSSLFHHEDISHMPASSCSQPIPKLPPLSLRASLVGITCSPQEKPNQASTKLSASFVCRQNSAVEIPFCLWLIIYHYLTTGNHDPRRCNEGGRTLTPNPSKVRRPLLGCNLFCPAEEETGKINSDWW